MNLNFILKRLEEVDPEAPERFSDRRQTIRMWGRTAALTALPLAMSSLFRKAYGQSSPIIIDTLNLALTQEYLESEFYQTALDKFGLIPAGADRDEIALILSNEQHHRDTVKATIESLGGTPIPKPTFDFTGGDGSMSGPYADVFTTYSTFLAVAQTFETNGLRALKGGAPNLMGNKAVLQAALTFHSVEARHAAHLIIMRRRNGFATIDPWLEGTDSGIPPGPQRDAAAGIYAGEDNTVQAGVEITTLSVDGVTLNAATATGAFDEPLTADQVKANVAPFIVP